MLAGAGLIGVKLGGCGGGLGREPQSSLARTAPVK